MNRPRLRRRSPETSGAVLERSGDVRPGVSLHGRLCSDYPEISGRAITDALDRALLVATHPSTPVEGPCRVEVHAREVLDALRARYGAATSRVGLPHPRSEATPGQIAS